MSSAAPFRVRPGLLEQRPTMTVSGLDANEGPDASILSHILSGEREGSPEKEPWKRCRRAARVDQPTPLANDRRATAIYRTGMVTFSSRLAQLLEKHPDMNAEKLAKLAGIDPSQVSRIRRGERNATAEQLKWIAGALDIPLGDLVAGTDAEATLTTPPKAASNPYFQGARGTIVDQESKVRDLEAQIRALTDDRDRQLKARVNAEKAKEAALTSLVLAAAEKATLTESLRQRCKEIVRTRELLAQAAEAVRALKTKGAELRSELAGENLLKVLVKVATPSLLGGRTERDAKALEFIAAFNALSETMLAKIFDTNALFSMDLGLDLPPPKDSEAK